MEQDLLAFLKQSFSAMEERLISAMDQRIGQQISAIDQRIGQQIQEFRQETAEQFARADQRFSNLETEVRELHIVVEDIQDKVQLTSEGIMNVNEKLFRHREEVSGRFNDLESLMRDSDRALASRVLKVEKKLKMAV